MVRDWCRRYTTHSAAQASLDLHRSIPGVSTDLLTPPFHPWLAAAEVPFALLQNAVHGGDHARTSVRSNAVSTFIDVFFVVYFQANKMNMATLEEFIKMHQQIRHQPVGASGEGGN